jgi:hypothetical protein
MTIEGVTLMYSHVRDEDNKESEVYRIIDDKNLPGATLALRRLNLAANGIKLKKLGRATFFLADFIKLARKTTWFIDSAGNVFQYKKDLNVKLTFKKIKQIIPISSGGAIVEVEGIPTRFKTLYMPDVENTYAGLLQHGMGYILYGTYTEKYKDTRRMI